MATVNVTIEKGGWQDVIALGSLSLTENQVYTISVLASGVSEVCTASSKPENTFRGHEATEKDNFAFTYKNEKIWVKLSPVAESTAIVVIS